jgi:hypothetical protein
MTKVKPKAQDNVLEGWDAIAKFLGQTVSVAQRWHKTAMPVVREGKRVHATPSELTKWVGTEMGKSEPVHIASEGEDLTANLKMGLSYIRKHTDSPRAPETSVPKGQRKS